MSDLTLAQLSMWSLYSAMAVLALALLGYTAYLAGLVPARSAARESARESAVTEDRELVGAGVGSGVAAGGVGMPSAPDAVAGDGMPSASVGIPGAIGAVGGKAGAGDSAPSGRAIDIGVPVRARKAAGIGWSLTLLGTVLLTVAVLLRALEVHRAPLGNMFEFAISGSMVAMLAYVAWSFRRDLRWLGVFIVAPVLGTLMLAISVWYVDAAELMPSLKSYWLVIHVSIAVISTALFGIGAALSVLYLWQDRVETAGTRSFMNRLPGARQLEHLSYTVHIMAFPLWTFTVIVGAIWARQAWGSYWNWDPKEVWSFVIWVAYAAYLHARVTSGWRRQNATMIALAGFACLIINYTVVNFFFVGQHSYSGLGR